MKYIMYGQWDEGELITFINVNDMYRFHNWHDKSRWYNNDLLTVSDRDSMTYYLRLEF